MQFKRVAVDTSKAVFTIHGIDAAERPVLRRNLSRSGLEALFSKRPATEFALEACGGSHHWGRRLQACGHTVPLVPPRYVKPFVKRSKTGRADAEALCEAAGRPGMRSVPVRSAEHQAEAMILGVRKQRHARPDKSNASPWILQPLRRRPRKLVAVANKMARIVWAMMARGQAYRQRPILAWSCARCRWNKPRDPTVWLLVRGTHLGQLPCAASHRPDT